MNVKRIKVTKDNIDEIRKELDYHLISLTLALECEHLKKHAPEIAN